MLLNTLFDEINLNTLKNLIKDEIMEGRQLDYKRELNLFSKEEKREFLKDVTALANSSGGYLIYGMKEGDDDESKGFPVEVCGFAPPDGVEQHIAKMENLIRDGVERPLHGYRIKTVTTDSDKPAIVMYVPSSATKPHWVSLYGNRKFYIRHETVSSPLDFGGLQRLFLLSETAAARIRDFRAERIGAILEGATPVSLGEGPKFVLHVVPLSVDNKDQTDGITTIKDANRYRFSFNFDGIYKGAAVPLYQGGEHLAHYFQIFRDGSVEYARNLPTKSEDEILASALEVYLGGEGNSEGCLHEILRWQSMMDLPSQSVYMLSLINVGGYKLVVTDYERIHLGIRVESQLVVKKHLLFNEIVSEQTPHEVGAAMNLLYPVLNIAWQSSDFDGSIYFDDKGNWLGPR